MNPKKIFWVGCPLFLTSALGFFFWRVHHPPMSEQDVALQRFISSHSAHVYLYSATVRGSSPRGSTGGLVDRVCVGSLTASEMSQVAGRSYIDNTLGTTTQLDYRYSVEVDFDQPPNEKHPLSIQLGLKERAGTVVTDGQGKMKREQRLYPLSTQAWTQFLFFHPRIGPSIRHRLGLK